MVRGVHLCHRMKTRAGVFLLATMVAGAGCTMSASSRRATMMAGGALALGGIVVIRSGAVDSNANGVNETWLNDDLGAYQMGSVLLLAGMAAFLGALASRAPDETDVPAVAPPPAPTTTTLAPPSTPTTTLEPATPPEPAETEAPEPTRGVIVERVPAVPLPEMRTSVAAERLARQVRSASTHGHCEVAWIMWADLEKLDPSYARAVRDGPVMARCVE